MFKKYCFIILLLALVAVQHNATLAMPLGRPTADAAFPIQSGDGSVNPQLDQDVSKKPAPLSQEIHKTQREIAEEMVVQRAWMSSCIVPGWGQAYNGHYKKIPAMYTLFLGLGAGAAYNHLLYKDNHEGFLKNSEENQPINASYYSGMASQHRTLRDLFLIFMGMVYIGNVIDAYAGASLKSFNLSDDISVEVQIPTAATPQLGLGLNLSFKL